MYKIDLTQCYIIKGEQIEFIALQDIENRRTVLYKVEELPFDDIGKLLKELTKQ